MLYWPQRKPYSILINVCGLKPDVSLSNPKSFLSVRMIIIMLNEHSKFKSIYWSSAQPSSKDWPPYQKRSVLTIWFPWSMNMCLQASNKICWCTVHTAPQPHVQLTVQLFCLCLLHLHYKNSKPGETPGFYTTLLSAALGYFKAETWMWTGAEQTVHTALGNTEESALGKCSTTYRFPKNINIYILYR